MRERGRQVCSLEGLGFRVKAWKGFLGLRVIGFRNSMGLCLKSNAFEGLGRIGACNRGLSLAR